MQTLAKQMVCLHISSFSRKQMFILWFLQIQWKEDTCRWVFLLALLEDCHYIWQGTLRCTDFLEDLAVWNGQIYVCKTDVTYFEFSNRHSTNISHFRDFIFFFRQVAVQKHIVVFCIHSTFYYFCYHICFTYWCWHWMLNLWWHFSS